MPIHAPARVRRAATGLFALLPALAVVPPASLDAQAPPAAGTVERHVLTGTTVALYNLAGTVRLEAGTGREVEVLVTRRGADAARLRIETGDVRGRRALRVVYPGDRIRWRGNRTTPGSPRWSTQLTVDEDGTFGGSSRGGRRVRIGGEGLDASADIVVRLPKGTDVAAFLGVGDVQAQGVDGRLLIDVSAADVTTTGTRGALKLDTGSGEVTVRDHAGQVDLDTGSGDLTLENVRGESLVLDAGSGSVEVRGLRVRTARFDLGSGETRLAAVTADDLTIDSGSGEVDVALTGTVRRLLIDSGSGDVTLRVPASYGATITVDAGSGGIDSEIPMRVTRRSRTMLRGTIGDGSGQLTIDSGSGEIRIVKAGT